jgi:hypothetical protein
LIINSQGSFKKCHEVKPFAQMNYDQVGLRLLTKLHNSNHTNKDTISRAECRWTLVFIQHQRYMLSVTWMLIHIVEPSNAFMQIKNTRSVQFWTEHSVSSSLSHRDIYDYRWWGHTIQSCKKILIYKLRLILASKSFVW